MQVVPYEALAPVASEIWFWFEPSRFKEPEPDQLKYSV